MQEGSPLVSATCKYTEYCAEILDVIALKGKVKSNFQKCFAQSKGLFLLLCAPVCCLPVMAFPSSHLPERISNIEFDRESGEGDAREQKLPSVSANFKAIISDSSFAKDRAQVGVRKDICLIRFLHFYRLKESARKLCQAYVL